MRRRKIVSTSNRNSKMRRGRRKSLQRDGGSRSWTREGKSKVNQRLGPISNASSPTGFQED